MVHRHEVLSRFLLLRVCDSDVFRIAWLTRYLLLTVFIFAIFCKTSGILNKDKLSNRFVQTTIQAHSYVKPLVGAKRLGVIKIRVVKRR